MSSMFQVKSGRKLAAASHTPGPWAYHGVDPMTDHITVFAGEGVVATVNNKPNAIANATLLAAAPDMLAALERISASIAYNHRTGQWADGVTASDLYDAARAAINKTRR